MLPNESTPPPTPSISNRLVDPISATTSAFQNISINNNLPLTPPRSADTHSNNWSITNGTMENRNMHSLLSRVPDTVPKVSTTPASNTTTHNLLTPTSMDRYIMGNRRTSDSSFASATS